MIKTFIAAVTCSVAFAAVAQAQPSAEKPMVWKRNAGSFNDRIVDFRQQYPVNDMDSPKEDASAPNARIIPEVVQGNQKHIRPGRSEKVMIFSGGDSRAEVYTLCVMPRLRNPNAMFTGRGVIANADIVALTQDLARLSPPHRVLVEYGVGGGAAQSVFLDLKRGFKIAVPASAITVTVFNSADISNPFFDDDSLYGIDVVATLARGSHGTDNDGVTFTSSAINLTAAGAPGGVATMAIPPHAKSFQVLVSIAGPVFGFGGGTINLLQAAEPVFAGVASHPQQIVLTGAGPHGPYPIVNGTTRISVATDAAEANNLDVFVVWNLNL